MFAELMDGGGWEVRYFPDSGLRNMAAMAWALSTCDLAYQIGGRITIGKFLRAARLMGKEKIVVHWIGSDVLDGEKQLLKGGPEPWVTEKLHHWAQSDWMLREVRALGVPCDLVPLPSTRVPNWPSPLPDQFSVLVYVPAVSRSSLYGLDRILEAARTLPAVSFELVGLVEGKVPDPPSNLRIHGRIPDLENFYRRASVVWRPSRHDGLSFMVLEALGHGRHVLWTYPFPGCRQVTSTSDACEEIKRLHTLHEQGRLEMNRMGVDVIATRGYSPQQIKADIRTRLERILDS